MIRIVNCDCMKLMGSLEDNSIDMIVTDPPYGVGFSKGFDDSRETVESSIDMWLKEMHRVLKDGSHCYFYLPTKGLSMWLVGIEKYFNLNNMLGTRTYTQSVYLKNNFKFDCQLVAYCSKGTAKRLNKVDFIKTSDAWFHDKRNKNPKEYTYSYPAFISSPFSNTKANQKNGVLNGRHPCEKNDELIKFFVELSSNENDIVLDMFIGSGSSAVAAIKSSRSFVGSELSEEYYKSAIEKIKRETGILEEDIIRE